jgi:diketogulonate reductase-like aldo/keto reductase
LQIFSSWICLFTVGLILLAQINFFLTKREAQDYGIQDIRGDTQEWKGQMIMVSTSFGEQIQMPAIGYGTCCRKTSKGQAIYDSTLTYLNMGGRLIDTAMAYKNHKEIGAAVKESKIKRNHLWITSKISVGKVSGEKNTIKAVIQILEELNTEYLDLCLIHSPKKGKQETIEIWKGLIEAQRAGLVRAIGVSNMNKEEVLDLFRATSVLPAVNEIQFHPWTPSKWKDLVKWQTSQNIATIAYTSLGGSRFHSSSEEDWPSIVGELSEKYHSKPTQILLKWALTQKVAVIPGSASPSHIQQNLFVGVPRFSLSEDEVQRLSSINPPSGWWDRKRGPNKFLNDQADQPWGEGR